MIGEINMIIAVGRKGEKMNDDTISRQAAIEIMEKWFFNLDDNRMPKEVLLEMPSAQHTTCKYWDTESDFCALYRPSAQPEPQWIPCGERLPEVCGRYLVTRGLNACGSLWNRVYIANYSDLMGLKKEKIWWDGNVGKTDFVKLDDVIAWMPLPEPYKEDETDV